MLSNEKYKELIDEIKALKDKRYSYDYNEDDNAILMRSVQSIINFNKILREAIKSMDKKGNDDTLTNFVSFSSKFLHFYLPKVVYITDSISEKTLRSAFNRSAKKASVGDKEKNNYKKLLSDLTKNVNYKSPNVKEEENGLKYIEHCCRAYVIACKLNNEYKQVEIKPRALDNYLLYYLAQKIKGPPKTELADFRRFATKSAIQLLFAVPHF